MNYFFVHLGNYPDWLKDSIKSVKKSDESSKIYLCGDSQEKIDGIENLLLSDIASTLTLKVMNSQLWKNDPNPLWRTSIYRIFILLDIMKETGSQDFVHFDSDVILFEGFETAKKSIDQNSKCLHITRCNDSEVVFGYSYCNSYQALHEICEYIDIAMYNNDFLYSLIKDHPNEMQILSGISRTGLIKDLPTIPSKEYIFDPSSYGQYLYGTHGGDAPGWAGNHHAIGKLINEGKLQVNMDKTPFATFNGVTSKIINLHIHSKKTGDINV